MITSAEQIGQEFVNYFQKLLGDKGRGETLNTEHICDGPRVTPDQCQLLVEEVTAQEIKSTSFKMACGKTPGPDAYSMKFFKDYWEIVGHDVITGIKHFFDIGYLLKEINNTAIVLVRKIEFPTKPSDYRPISCCNIVYKCISSIITARLKNVVSQLIGPK